MQKFTFFVLYNFGFWGLAAFCVEVFQHCGVHCVLRLKNEYKVGEASQLGIRIGLWLWSIVLPSGMEPHGLEDLEMSGRHFLLSFN
jgi:hypothetical protein